MDAPLGGHPEAMRDEKARVLQAVTPLSPESVVRGQFRGYREEPGVAADSQVETFAAVRLQIDNWRWAGVPFYIRAGKCLPGQLHRGARGVQVAAMRDVRRKDGTPELRALPARA